MEVDPDVYEHVMSLLKQLSQDIASGRTPNESTVRKLREDRAPLDVMHVLVPHLFRNNPDGDALSSQAALVLIQTLVGSDPSSYLKPASLAVLHETTRLVNSPGEELYMLPETLFLIASQLQGEDVQVADNATQALSFAARKLGSTFVRQTLNVVNEIWNTYWENLKAGRHTVHSSTVCVRCANAIKELAVLEDSFMQATTGCGASDVWTKMLTYQNDPLLQLSTLDLLEQLASKQPFHVTRTQWLLGCDNNTMMPLRPIIQMAGGLPEFSDSPDPLLGSASLRVVTSLCKLLHSGDPALVNESGWVLSSFHRALHNWDEQTSGSEVDRLTMLDAISSFASASDDALSMVLDDPVTRHAWLSLRSLAQSKLKSAILMSVAQVLDPSIVVRQGAESWTTRKPSNAMALKLFSSLGQANETSYRGDTMDLLMQLVKSPMPEVRIGVYALLAAVAKMASAGQVLWNHGEFFPLVLSRENETTKEGREAKYGVVAAILQSSIKGLLSEDLVKRLEQYHQQGPHYKKVQNWDVATE